jgi:hypothetical protein
MQYCVRQSSRQLETISKWQTPGTVEYGIYHTRKITPSTHYLPLNFGVHAIIAIYVTYAIVLILHSVQYATQRHPYIKVSVVGRLFIFLGYMYMFSVN